MNEILCIMTDKPENEREKEININLLFKSIIHKSEKNEHAFATSNKGRICAHSNLNFEYFSINLFCHNSTSIRQDKSLARWFIHEVAPSLKEVPGVEVLIENTDLGVG